MWRGRAADEKNRATMTTPKVDYDISRKIPDAGWLLLSKTLPPFSSLSSRSCIIVVSRREEREQRTEPRNLGGVDERETSKRGKDAERRVSYHEVGE